MLAGPAAAAPLAAAVTATASSCSQPPGAVSCTPAPGTPALTSGGTVQQIRQIVQCGSMMYAVGSFTTLTGYDASTRNADATFHRSNAFSFAATPPYAVSNWRPDVNGEVNSIAVGGGHCSTAYLGGSFGQVHRQRARNIVAVSTSAGTVRTSFRHDANNTVLTLVLHGRHLLAGGFFTSINGSSHHYYVSLNRTTGANDGYLDLHISGRYSYPGARFNRTRVFNQQVSHSGGRLLAEGDFTSVGGKRRQQIFMLSLAPRRARLTSWNSTEFYERCQVREPYYLRAAAWSPDDSTVYIATTGYHLYLAPIGMTPRTGLCDAAAAFPAGNRQVRHKWINYTGCDSLYAAAGGNGIAYFGGHERWADNNDNCDAASPAAIPAPGMVGLSASAGTVVFNPTRSRGLGADDMLLTSAGLWIASDTFGGPSQCGGQPGFAGICLLPYGSSS